MSYFTKVISSFSLSAMICFTTLSASQESRLLDLQVIHSVFESHYAPKQWKETHLGWDLEHEYAEARRKVIENPDLSSQGFFRVVRDFARSSQDYHVGCEFDTTEAATLPFSVKSANGRYFVCSIDKKRLDTELFPIANGDELLNLNDQPVDEIAQDIISQTSLGVKDADQAIADACITHRYASMGLDVPKGLIRLVFLDRETGRPKHYQMVWRYHPEYVTFHRKASSKPKKANQLFQRDRVAAKGIRSLELTGKRKLLGYKKSDLPRLGKIKWENPSDNFYQAYIFKTKEEEYIGFLRIPHYFDLDDFEDQMDELVNIINRFEGTTSQLVIDQRDNPGGRLDLLYQVASLFASQPLFAPKERFMMTPGLISSCRQELKKMELVDTEKHAKRYLDDNFFGVKNSLHLVNMLKLHCEFLVSEWESGINLSDPIFAEGVDIIQAHPQAVYTKPILLLVNELSMSCGDICPAIMQDSNRAVIMGNRTAGAGGAVRKRSLINNDGVTRISYTTTIAERHETKTPLENLGVTPDVLYKVTENDLRDGYKEYKAAILEVLKCMRELGF